jgi:hypothetical protein
VAERIKNVGSEINPTVLAHPTLAFLRDYWEQKRGSRAMPARADIDPAEMRHHLGWMILADVLPGLADFRYRLIGTRVTQYFQRNITGKTISEAYAENGPAAQKMALAVYRKVARDRVVLRTFGDIGWLGHDFLEFDQLFVPLSDDGSAVNMVLSAFTFDYRQQTLKRPQLY